MGCRGRNTLLGLLYFLFPMRKLASARQSAYLGVDRVQSNAGAFDVMLWKQTQIRNCQLKQPKIVRTICSKPPGWVASTVSRSMLSNPLRVESPGASFRTRSIRSTNIRGLVTR